MREEELWRELGRNKIAKDEMNTEGVIERTKEKIKISEEVSS